MDGWIAAAVAQAQAGELDRIVRFHERGHEVLAAEGDELERPCCAKDGAEEWRERGGGGSIPHACQPTSSGAGKTSDLCGDEPCCPDASPRSG